MVKHKVTATITLDVEAVFDADTEHPLADQAIPALEAEAEWRYCLKPEEMHFDGIKTVPLV